LSNQTIMMVVPWLLLLFTWYSLWGLQGKIHCQFHRKDRTVIDRRIKMTDKKVSFGKGDYEVNPKRFSIKWFKLWSIFPYPMIFQEWKWDTDQPLDPTTFKNAPDSPEALQASNSEKDWKNFNYEGSDKSGGGKESGLMKWLPLITAGVVVIGLFFLYSTFNGKLGIIEQQIQSLGGMINKIPK
jgi:hypothetical protein